MKRYNIYNEIKGMTYGQNITDATTPTRTK